ncbi:hypothetical protein FQZ97_899770 [compost metagenome]
MSGRHGIRAASGQGQDAGTGVEGIDPHDLLINQGSHAHGDILQLGAVHQHSTGRHQAQLADQFAYRTPVTALARDEGAAGAWAGGQGEAQRESGRFDAQGHEPGAGEIEERQVRRICAASQFAIRHFDQAPGGHYLGRAVWRHPSAGRHGNEAGGRQAEDVLQGGDGDGAAGQRAILDTASAEHDLLDTTLQRSHPEDRTRCLLPASAVEPDFEAPQVATLGAHVTRDHAATQVGGRDAGVFHRLNRGPSLRLSDRSIYRPHRTRLAGDGVVVLENQLTRRRQAAR